MMKKVECPICFSTLILNDEKILTCPYCDALLYNIEGTLKLVSKYPWWQKKDPDFEKYRKELGIAGLIRTDQTVELYINRDRNWYLIFNGKQYLKKLDIDSSPESYEQKLETRVSYIYGRVPVFTPLDFEATLFICKNCLVKREASSYSFFEDIH